MSKRSRNVEIRNWKFGLHAFVLLMNAFNFGPSYSIIALYSVAFDSDKTFLLISFRNAVRRDASTPEIVKLFSESTLTCASPKGKKLKIRMHPCRSVLHLSDYYCSFL